MPSTPSAEGGLWPSHNTHTHTPISVAAAANTAHPPALSGYKERFWLYLPHHFHRTHYRQTLYSLDSRVSSPTSLLHSFCSSEFTHLGHSSQIGIFTELHIAFLLPHPLTNAIPTNPLNTLLPMPILSNLSILRDLGLDTAGTILPMQGLQVQSLVRNRDPTPPPKIKTKLTSPPFPEEPSQAPHFYQPILHCLSFPINILSYFMDSLPFSFKVQPWGPPFTVLKAD